MAKILIVEDDAEQALMLSEFLQAQHHRVEVEHDGSDGLERALASEFDLIILDWELPRMTGIEICKQFRTHNKQTPVMMLTGKSMDLNKEAGLDSGADDYLTKPFSIREMGARVRALLRRSSQAGSNILQVRDITLDPQKFLVTRGNIEVQLVAREFSLLEFLMRHPDEVFSPDALLQRVWHSESEATPEALRTCIARLRKKLDIDGLEPSIATVHGVGYKIKSR